VAAVPGEGDTGAGILLTGVTGYFGAFLLSELLAATDRTGQRISCLIRAEDAGHARRRLRANLAQYHLWDPSAAERVDVVVGDLARPRLGLSSDDYARLAAGIDTIFHNGAQVNHLLSAGHLEAANVDGTRALIQLAAEGRPKRLHFMSTPAVADNADSGYAESKRRSESLLRDAVSEGVFACVYRLPRLAPDSRTGLPNVNDIMIRLLDIILQLGFAPDAAAAEYWVAVDAAATAIVQAAGQARGGEVFALRSPEPVTLRLVVDVAVEAGFAIAFEPLERWVERVRGLGLGDYDVTLGVLGLDGADVAGPAEAAGGLEKYGTPIIAPGSAREDLKRYFVQRRSGF
jgi:thioester reductase-like protein